MSVRLWLFSKYGKLVEEKAGYHSKHGFYFIFWRGKAEYHVIFSFFSKFDEGFLVYNDDAKYH
jgi:hypothetical protein